MKGASQTSALIISACAPDAVIIDAGSSGSRVYVYKWQNPPANPPVKKVVQLGESKTGENLANNFANLVPVPNEGLN